MARKSADPAAPQPERPSDPFWHDSERLEALDRYAILDTPPEPQFDDLVQLAADICHTPIALLSIVAADRQWFKATVGFGLKETPLDSSICAHLMMRPGLTVIPDLAAEGEHRCNPLVTSEPGFRFYAGVRLTSSEGLPLGSLCVIDTKPRPEGLTAFQARALGTLAAQTMDSLELRRLLAERVAAGQKARRAARERATVVLASISDGVFALDPKWRFILFNSAAERFFEMRARDVLGRPFGEVFPGALPSTVERFRRVLESRQPTSFEAEVASLPGRVAQFRVSTMNGGIAVSFTDVTEWKRAEEAQRLLVAELQHRTRNLLAVVRSIAAQTVASSTSLEEFARAFNSRLSALGRVQSLLSQRGGVHVSLRELVENELVAHGSETDGARIRLDGPDVELPAKAVQILALALHELATNALKYGALSQPQARLVVHWELQGPSDKQLVAIRWTEEGVRLPEGASERPSGFGRQLIERALPYDLGAKTRFRIAEDGVRCELDLPLQR